MAAGLSLAFTTGRDPVSWLIRLLTRSRCSHVAVAFDLYEMPVLVHAAVGGVRVLPRWKWFRLNKLVAEYRIRADLRDNMPFALSCIGTDYDYPGLLGFVPVLLWRWLGKKIKNPFASPRALVCSEFALQLDPNGKNIPEWRGLDPEATEPGDLLEICEKSVISFERMAPLG